MGCNCGKKRGNRRLRSAGRNNPTRTVRPASTRNSPTSITSTNTRVQALRSIVDDEEDTQSMTEAEKNIERKKRNQIVRRTLRG